MAEDEDRESLRARKAAFLEMVEAAAFGPRIEAMYLKKIARSTIEGASPGQLADIDATIDEIIARADAHQAASGVE